MREKKLIINSVLYFIGSLGKGVSTILVVFIASFYIDPTDMGVYDLVISTITLIQPIIIFQINDGIYRWLLEDKSNKDSIIKSGFQIAYRNMVIANLLLIPVLFFINLDHKIFILLVLNLNCLYPLYQQITRGLKNHKIFAVSGIINGVCILLISYILMKYFMQGVKGFYAAQVIANGMSILYLALKQKICFLPIRGDKQKIRQIMRPMTRYAIMLVPNSVNQWVMKALDKYCILFYMTTYDNGIYTVTHRFPDILIMLNNMFYSAWVEQSIVEYSSDDRDVYFSKIYNTYSSLICTVVLLVIPITKYFILTFVGEQYSSAYLYVPFLYIGVVFLGLSGFIGTGYLGTKKTTGILWTSLAGAFTNTVINIICMPLWGLDIAAISSCMAYFVMWVIRLWQTRKFFRIKVDWLRFFIQIICCILFACGVKQNSFLLDWTMEVVAVLMAVTCNFPLYKKFILKK